MLRYKDKIFNIGDLLEFTIKDCNVEGKLNYDGYRYYVCHNDNRFDGRQINDRLGYRYSWAFYPIGDCLSDQVDIKSETTIKPAFSIEPKLLEMLSGINIEILSLVKLTKILPDYVGFKIAKEKGMITLVNTKGREVDMKFGRFIKSISVCSDTFTPSDSEIEKYHNKFVSFFENDSISVEILNGKDIEIAYKIKNHTTNFNRLAKSCMNDRTNYLSIYYDNPDRISVVVLKKFDRIVGRALLWLTDCGTKILDRQYVSEDWVDSKFEELCRDNDYKSVYRLVSHDYSVSLKNVDLDSEVPYIDSFRYLNKENNKLYLKYERGYVYFNETDGTYSC